MPTHKGIRFSIVSQTELAVHPEFAHPETSQFTNRSPSLHHGADPQPIEQSPPAPSSSESKADRLLGRPSVVSVYIPSVPGSRFWLRYTIEEEAVRGSPWYYFKLYMNGRHIASWGTNSETSPSGQVMRGLFEPTDKWNYRYEGTTFKCMGTETRPFFFANEEEMRSAANDGGLIEVKAYRAKGRKQKMPEPPDWKSQDDYGIIMPSSGLHETPQDAKYYEWLLRDPKEIPFARFRFHYRSWNSLESLQLIPPQHSRKLLPSSASLLSLNGLSREMQAQLQEIDTEEGGLAEIESLARRSIDSEVSDTPWLTTVFDAAPDETPRSKENRDIFNIPPELAHLSQSRIESIADNKLALAIVDEATSPENDNWKDYMGRPLPVVPTRRSSIPYSRRHSRKTSSDSTAPSITLSLKSYLDRDNMSPEPELGIAEIVPVTKHASPIFKQKNPGSVEYSPSTYSNSSDIVDERLPIPVISPVKSSENMPPFRKLMRSISRRNSSGSVKELSCMTPPPFLVPGITVRKSRNSPPKTPSKNSASQSSHNDYSLSITDDHSTMDNTTTLSLSEAEWMCRTPSPLKKNPALHGNQSPLTAKKINHHDASSFTSRSNSETASLLSKSNSETSSLLSKSGRSRKGTFGDGKSSLRKKAMGWYGKVRNGDSSEENDAGRHGLSGMFDPVEGKDIRTPPEFDSGRI